MANSLKKNVYYIDTVGTVTTDTMKPVIEAILIVPSATNSVVQIKESVSGTIVLEVIIETTESRYLTFEAMHRGGIEVTDSFEISELTNIEKVVLYGRFKKEGNRA